MFSNDRAEEQLKVLLNQQSKRFEFLLQPESYLLCASLLSGLFAIPFIMLNGVAIACVARSCDALLGSTATDWVAFELVTAFFVGISIGTGLQYRRIVASRRGDS